MREWPWAWPSICVCVCSVLPDGTVIGIQFDSRSKLLNLLYLDEEHICQENTKQCSIWICDDFIFFVYQKIVVDFKTYLDSLDPIEDIQN